jgi:ABC-type iron transport system FetAB ATPase subunit
MRTSDFSAPYNIIFNATYHQFAIIKSSNQFNHIPLRVPQGNSIQIIGPAGVQL